MSDVAQESRGAAHDGASRYILGIFAVRAAEMIDAWLREWYSQEERKCFCIVFAFATNVGDVARVEATNQEARVALKRKGDGRVTIAQIASEAGVSITTVSKVLNHMPGVAQETRDRVERVVERRKYVQSHAARLLRKSQTGLIDLVIMRLEGGYDLGIMRGVQDVLETTGHRLVVFATHEDETLERRWLTRVLEQASDGVLLLLPYERSGLANVLIEHRIPFVAIGERNDLQVPFPSIGSTIWQGGYAATEYLIRLGHKRIGIITGPLTLRTSRARLAGYREAMESAGIPVDPALILEGNYLLGDGYDQTCTLLDLPEPPTAIFAGNDAQAAGVYRALYERNIKIPDVMSVVGFDDVPYSSQMSPPLTTIRQPLVEIGRMATNMLLRLIAGEALEATHVELSTSLIIRESCAAPASSAASTASAPAPLPGEHDEPAAPAARPRTPTRRKAAEHGEHVANG